MCGNGDMSLIRLRLVACFDKAHARIRRDDAALQAATVANEQN
jgi:hypothetical protein